MSASRYSRREVSRRLRDMEDSYAGCFKAVYDERADSIVGVYNTAEAELDDSRPWAIVCETHSSLLLLDDLGAALKFAPVPDEWCDSCSEIVQCKELAAARLIDSRS